MLFQRSSGRILPDCSGLDSDRGICHWTCRGIGPCCSRRELPGRERLPPAPFAWVAAEEAGSAFRGLRARLGPGRPRASDGGIVLHEAGGAAVAALSGIEDARIRFKLQHPGRSGMRWVVPAVETKAVPPARGPVPEGRTAAGLAAARAGAPALVAPPLVRSAGGPAAREVFLPGAGKGLRQGTPRTGALAVLALVFAGVRWKNGETGRVAELV